MPSPVVASLPCVGRGQSDYAVTQANVESRGEAFPGIDVLAEVRKARAWLEANPTKRKTHRGIPAFLVRWLSKAQDDGRGRGAAPAGTRHGMVPRGTGARFGKGWDDPEWMAVLQEHAGLPVEEQRQGLRDLDVRFTDGAFEVKARDALQAEYLRERYEAGVVKLAQRALGREVPVRFVAPGSSPQRAGGPS